MLPETSVVESGVAERGLKDVGGGECARRSGMSGVCAERDVRVICRYEKYHQSASLFFAIVEEGQSVRHQHPVCSSTVYILGTSSLAALLLPPTFRLPRAVEYPSSRFC